MSSSTEGDEGNVGGTAAGTWYSRAGETMFAEDQSSSTEGGEGSVGGTAAGTWYS